MLDILFRLEGFLFKADLFCYLFCWSFRADWMHSYRINISGESSVLRIGLEFHTVCMTTRASGLKKPRRFS
jgi:hypothetical protein